MSIINLRESAWFLEAPWTREEPEEKTVTVEVELDLNKEQMEKLGGKLKVNVSVPV